MMNKAPKNLRGEVEWNKYRRGQVDRLFLKFRNWLEGSTSTNGGNNINIRGLDNYVHNRTRLKMCKGAKLNEDSKLWADIA